MPASLSAVDSLYNNSYGNLYSNPYFLQAYNSPNYSQILQVQQLQQQVAQQQQLQNSGQVGAQVGANNVAFQGAQSAIANESKEKSGSNTTAWVLGIGATAIGIGWWLASRGKARNATGLWNQIKTGFTSLFNKPTVIKGAEQITKNKDALKINEALKWTDEAANLRRFEFDLKDADGVVQKFAYSNGEITTKAYKDGRLSDALKNQVDDIVEIIKGKDISKLLPDVTLKNIQYTANLENGIGLYRAVTPDAVNNLQFVRAQL